MVPRFHGRVGLQVEGPKKDLHSGVYGGAVIEPMIDLIGVMGECRICWDGEDKRVGFRHLRLELLPQILSSVPLGRS